MNKDNSRFEYKTMFCSCGCGNGIVLKAYRDKDIGTALEFVSNNFYSGRNSMINVFKEKVKRVWYIIIGKEYCYFDILIDNEELQEFKEFVSKL
ncbi:MAG: hypothetical protein NC489_28980 [Ruminococcus flavefaciens]|nr:hypothetical protein [Ruminococcus flavefaciens]